MRLYRACVSSEIFCSFIYKYNLFERLKYIRFYCILIYTGRFISWRALPVLRKWNRLIWYMIDVIINISSALSSSTFLFCSLLYRWVFSRFFGLGYLSSFCCFCSSCGFILIFTSSEPFYAFSFSLKLLGKYFSIYSFGFFHCS